MGQRYRTKLVLKVFPSIPKGVFGGGRLTQWLERRLFYREFQFSPWKLTFVALLLATLSGWSVWSLVVSWTAIHQAETLRVELSTREQRLVDQVADLNAAKRDYLLLLSRLQPIDEKVGELTSFSQKLAMVAGIDDLAEELGTVRDPQHADITLSEQQVAELSRRFERLGSFMANQQWELSRTPSISPLAVRFVPTDRYGYRSLRMGRRGGQASGGEGRQFHSGLDLAAPIGTPIHATADATVHFAGRVPRKQSPGVARYGNFVVLEHGNGVRTIYAHCDRLNVEQGDEIRRGDLIAWVGNTGRSTGPHLHYEVVVNGRHRNRR